MVSQVSPSGTSIKSGRSGTSAADILVITLKYHLDRSNPYLTNILVSGLRQRGLIVNVIALGDVDHDGMVDTGSGLEYFGALGSSRRITKYLGLVRVVLNLLMTRRRQIIGARKVVFFAPVSVYLPIFHYFVRKSQRSVGIVFDVFPKHHCQIDSIPDQLLRPLRWLEARLLARCDQVTAMSPANKRCMVEEYALPAERIALLPLWVPPLQTERMRDRGPADRQHVCQSTQTPVVNAAMIDPGVVETTMTGPIRFVFGGQLTRGRSIGYAIEFLEILRQTGLDIRLSIYSSGPVYDTEAARNSRNWVSFEPRLSAEDYRKVLPEYDIGLAVTDERVTLPTFPSKIPEYLIAGVRAFCFLEDANDVDAIVQDKTLLHVNRFSISEGAMDAARVFCLSATRPMTTVEIETARTQFSVEHACDTLLEILGDDG